MNCILHLLPVFGPYQAEPGYYKNPRDHHNIKAMEYSPDIKTTTQVS